jgi:glycosyltransferase involved in cell wall biosynthesis
VREHLATQYASADIFLFPSITETYGNVTVEAMASGLAVIAYDCAAAKQHIRHNINGLLAPFDATDDFVKLATALAPDTSRIRAMGAAARASAEKMDCKSATVNYEQALLVLSTDQTEPLFPANAIA